MFTTVPMQAGLPKMMSRVLVCLFTTDGVASPRPNSSSASRSARRPSPRRSRPREPDARPPGTRRTPPRALPRRRRPLVPVDDGQRRTNAQLAEITRQGVGASSAAAPWPPPAREHRPLLRLRRREHHPRRGAGPQGPCTPKASPEAKLDLEDLHGERRYRPQAPYAQSKLADLLFAYELERRLQGPRQALGGVAPWATEVR